MELRKALQLNPMLRWVGALIAGIVAADGLAHCVSANCWQWLLAGTVGLLLATYLLHEERRVWPQCLLLVAATFLLGATLQGRAQERLSVMVPNEAVEYEAVVSSEPQAKGKTARMDLLVTRVGDRPLPRPVSVRASLLRDTATARWQSLHVGCGIRAYARFERLRTMGHRSRFDYIRWAQVHGYQAQTFIYYSHWEPAVVSIRTLSIMQRARLKLLGFRQNLLRRFHALGLDDQQYAVVAAMALGDKSGLSQATKDSYAISGASHVLALSGLHLGIVYGLLTWVFGMRRRWLWVGQGLALTAVWSYGLSHQCGVVCHDVHGLLRLPVAAPQAHLHQHTRLGCPTDAHGQSAEPVGRGLSTFVLGRAGHFGLPTCLLSAMAPLIATVAVGVGSDNLVAGCPTHHSAIGGLLFR